MNFNSSLSHTFPINYRRNNNFVPWHQEINIYQMLGCPPLAFRYNSLPPISTSLLIQQHNNYYNPNLSFQYESTTDNSKNFANQKAINNQAQKNYVKPAKSRQNTIRKPIEIIQLSDDSDHTFIPQQKKDFLPIQKINDKQKQMTKILQLQQNNLKYQIEIQKIEKRIIQKNDIDKIKQQKKTKRKRLPAYEDFEKLYKDHQKNKKNKRIKKFSQYILSDFEKHSLEILKYRQYNHKQIMQGPLFQANIPKFIKNTKNYQIIKNKKRQFLMMRLER